MTTEATVDKRTSTVSKTDKPSQVNGSKPYVPMNNQFGQTPNTQAYAGPKIVVNKGGR